MTRPPGPLRRALVRRPSDRLAEGLLTHQQRREVDVELAHLQWAGYVAVLERAGFVTHEVPPAPDLPDSVFVEDTLVVAGPLAVVTRPGAPQRRPEVEAVRESAFDWGLHMVELPDHIEGQDVWLDGGDVLKVGSTAYVGIGGRTTAAGAEALRRTLADVGIRVIPVPISSTLHLKSQVTALPDGTVIGFGPLVDEPGRWPGFLGVPEEAGAHVVVLDDSQVLLSDSAPRTATLLTERGLAVTVVPISEFEKLEGCVTCLSVRWHPWD